MGFVDAAKTGFRKFATFSGRATRSEYWFFFLFILVVGALLGIVDGLIFGPTTTSEIFTEVDGAGNVTSGERVLTAYGSGPVSNLWSLLTILPLLAAGFRRLHDTDRPGWYLFIPLIVMIAGMGLSFAAMGMFTAQSPAELASNMRSLGPLPMLLAVLICFGSAITLLIWLCRASTTGPNHYGPNPLEVTP